MAWSGSGRILLVWPKHGNIHIRDFDLQVLQHKASETGSQLGIVCTNPTIIEKAKELGIPSFSSVPNAETGHWVRRSFQAKSQSERPHRALSDVRNNKKTKPTSARMQKVMHIAAVTLGALSIISLLAFLLPSATIKISPETALKSIPINVWASPKFTATNLNGNLPAYEKTVQISDSASAQSTGSTGLTTSFASGTVIFENLSDTDLTVPAGTIVSTDAVDGIRFATDTEIVVPVNSTDPVTVTIKALEAGVKGNVTQNSITEVEGTLGGLLTVTNPEPTVGGQDTVALSPSEEDYQKLQKMLLETLHDKVQTQFALENDQQLIKQSIKMEKIISETRSVEVGQPADQFSLTLTVEFSGLTYSQLELEKLAGEIITASLSSGEEMYGSDLNFSLQDDLKGVAQGGYTWSVIASASVGPKINQTKMARLVSGKTYQEAKSLLENALPLKVEPIFEPKFSPIWLPFAEFRILFEVK